MNKIEELKNNICKLTDELATRGEFIDALHTLLTKYTHEVAKIDEASFKNADRITYPKGRAELNSYQQELIKQYNRLITEKYQAQPEKPEPEPNNSTKYKVGMELEAIDTCVMNTGIPALIIGKKYQIDKVYDRGIELTSELGKYHDFPIDLIEKYFRIPELELRVGWEYQNGEGIWKQIVNKIEGASFPFRDELDTGYQENGKWGLCGDSLSDLNLSTGRPMSKQPSTNWWESLKGGELVKDNDGVVNTVVNWYREELGNKRVWIWCLNNGGRPAESFKLYTPTPSEAVGDLKRGKITEEQFMVIMKLK